MQDYNTADEFRLMQEAGMTFDQILAALTTVPEKLLCDVNHKGTIEVGKSADIILLSKNPKDK